MTELEAICRTIAWFRHRNSRRIDAIKAEHPEMSAADLRQAEAEAIDHVWPLYTDMATEILACLEARKRGEPGPLPQGRPAAEPEMGDLGELMQGFLGPRHYIAVVLFPNGEIRRITTLCDHHEGDVLRSIIEDLDETTPHGPACGSRTLN